MILASVPILKESEMPTNGSFIMERDHRNDYIFAYDSGHYYDQAGDIFFYWNKPDSFDRFAPQTTASVDETEGIFLDDPNHLILLQQLAYFEAEGWCARRRATKNTEGKKSILSYQVTANWDEKSQKGVSPVVCLQCRCLLHPTSV